MSRITYIPNRVIDTNGISDGALVYVYESGTSTPVSLFADAGFVTPVSNPYTVAAGAAVPPLYTDHVGTLRVRVAEDGGAVVQDDDPYEFLVTDAVLSASGGSDLIGYIADSDDAVERTVQGKLRESLSVLDFIPVEYHDAIRGGTSTQNVATYIQAALDYQDTSVAGSFELLFPDGTYCVSGSGTRILEIQNGTKITGQSLEGTQIKVLSGSTATYLLEDNGNAAKIEIYNITFSGNDNTALTVGIRLGVRSIQFGTYGCLDNVSVRDMPNATAYELDCNIVACGKLYCLSVANGLVSNSGGSGLFVEAFYPTDWSGVGATLALADYIGYMEAEAPASDDAIALYFERGGSIFSFYLAIGAGRQMKTPIKINTDTVSDFSIGKVDVAFADSTAKYGDTSTPDDSGTATSGGANTLTDTSKTWTRNQWKNAAVHITSGTGAGQFRVVLSNNGSVLTTRTIWSVNPDATSVYKLSYFARSVNTGGTFVGGYGVSNTFTGYHPWYRTLTATQTVTNSILIGRSTDAKELFGIMRVAATLDFPSVAAGAVQSLTANVAGAPTGGEVLISVNSSLQATAGIAYHASISSTGVVTVYAKNFSAGAIDPASATFGITVLTYS